MSEQETTQPQELLNTFLASNDVECPVCDYNLNGLIRNECPECGSTIQLQVGSGQIKLGPWLIAWTVFGLALGIDLFIGILMMIMVIDDSARRTPINLSVGVSSLILAIGTALFMWVLVQRRQRWMRSSHRRRVIGTITICIVFPLAQIAIFFGLSLLGTLLLG